MSRRGYKAVHRDRARALNGPGVEQIRHGQQTWPKDWFVMPCWCEGHLYKVPHSYVLDGIAPTCGSSYCKAAS